VCVLRRRVDRFLTGDNLSLVLQQVMVVGVIAIGQTLVILTAGVDLSCGTVMALGNIVMTKLAAERGLPAPLAIAAGVGVTTLFGLVNGLLVSRVRLPRSSSRSHAQHRVRAHADLLGVSDHR